MGREKIIKFLENPKSYSQPVKKVKHIQTYISDVFLTGRYAYKIKKPVNYGYLDFTTLAKRKFFCRRELELNKRLSPQIYLDVLSIVKKETKAIRRNRRVNGEGGLQFGGRGKLAEYVLKMKEIPQKYMMYRLLKLRKVNKKIIDRMAKIIAKFHQKAATSKKISFFGSLKIINKNWQENFSQTKPFIGKTIALKDWQFIKKVIEEFIAKNKKLFLQRIKNKKIRDCHGDLHVGNIFVTPNRIYIFDCIEFNERFRYQDTASEIANLLFGIDTYDQKLADYFLEKYINYSGDKISRKLVLFYKCYRAYIKSKIFGFYTKEKTFSAAKKQSSKKIAQQAFIWAKKYAEELQKPILIIGIGLPGVGKSRRLDLLARKTGFKILKTDKIRRELKRKIDYKPKSRILVYVEMIKRAKKILKRGESLILDASFIEKKQRDLAQKLARELKVPYYFIEFYVDEKTIKQRFIERKKEKKPVSEANWQVYQKIKKESEPIKNEQNYFKINTTQTPEQCAKEIIKKLSF